MSNRPTRPWITGLTLLSATLMAGCTIRIQWWMQGRELGLGAPGLHMLSGLLGIIAVSLFSLVLRDWLKQRAERHRD